MLEFLRHNLLDKSAISLSTNVFVILFRKVGKTLSSTFSKFTLVNLFEVVLMLLSSFVMRDQRFDNGRIAGP